MEDVMRNIMLFTDYQTIINLHQISNMVKKICQDKNFWIQKFHIKLDDNLNYLKQYTEYYQFSEIVKKIITVSQLEYQIDRDKSNDIKYRNNGDLIVILHEFREKYPNSYLPYELTNYLNNKLKTIYQPYYFRFSFVTKNTYCMTCSVQYIDENENLFYDEVEKHLSDVEVKNILTLILYDNHDAVIKDNNEFPYNFNKYCQCSDRGYAVKFRRIGMMEMFDHLQ